MSSPAAYSFTLDDAEIERYAAMADHARRHESAAWDAAGIEAGASVVDLGCGPGTFLPALESRVGPEGRVIGVDRSDDAVQRAFALVARLGLESRVEVRSGACDDTGLAPGSVDVVFVRNVLVHNGPNLSPIFDHVRGLLADGGRLLVAEPDLTGLVLPDDAPDEQDLEQRWRDWMTSAGNDPALGRHLAAAVTAHHFDVVLVDSHCDTFTVERSPAWTARQRLVDAGLATNADVARWQAAIEQRLATTGPMPVTLPTTVVVASPMRR